MSSWPQSAAWTPDVAQADLLERCLHARNLALHIPEPHVRRVRSVAVLRRPRLWQRSELENLRCSASAGEASDKKMPRCELRQPCSPHLACITGRGKAQPTRCLWKASADLCHTRQGCSTSVHRTRRRAISRLSPSSAVSTAFMATPDVSLDVRVTVSSAGRNTEVHGTRDGWPRVQRSRLLSLCCLSTQRKVEAVCVMYCKWTSKISLIERATRAGGTNLRWCRSWPRWTPGRGRPSGRPGSPQGLHQTLLLTRTSLPPVAHKAAWCWMRICSNVSGDRP